MKEGKERGKKKKRIRGGRDRRRNRGERKRTGGRKGGKEGQRRQEENVLRWYQQWSTAPQDPALFQGPFVQILAEAFRHVKSSQPAYQLACLRLKIAKPAVLDPWDDEVEYL